jgi:hypothetical protein
MRKETLTRLTLMFALVGVGLLTAMPAAAQTVTADRFGNGYGWGNGNGPASDGSACCVTTTPTVPLTADETMWLAYMREEEKLARDVYQQLYTKWKLRIFSNIARSEQRHFESVGSLITAYGVQDPAAGAQAGVFTDTKLASLYQSLIAKGMVSIKDALEVGVVIEKVDIADLESALKATQKTDLKTVFTNLLAGSLNHQEAFENTLEVVQ